MQMSAKKQNPAAVGSPTQQLCALLSAIRYEDLPAPVVARTAANPPAASALTPTAACTAELRCVVVPSPNRPLELSPIAHSVPSLFRKRL